MSPVLPKVSEEHDGREVSLLVALSPIANHEGTPVSRVPGCVFTAVLNARRNDEQRVDLPLLVTFEALSHFPYSTRVSW